MLKLFAFSAKNCRQEDGQPYWVCDEDDDTKKRSKVKLRSLPKDFITKVYQNEVLNRINGFFMERSEPYPKHGCGQTNGGTIDPSQCMPSRGTAEFNRFRREWLYTNVVVNVCHDDRHCCSGSCCGALGGCNMMGVLNHANTCYDGTASYEHFPRGGDDAVNGVSVVTESGETITYDYSDPNFACEYDLPRYGTGCEEVKKNWYLGSGRESCTEVCREHNLYCTSFSRSKMSSLTAKQMNKIMEDLPGNNGGPNPCTSGDVIRSYRFAPFVNSENKCHVHHEKGDNGGLGSEWYGESSKCDVPVSFDDDSKRLCYCEDDNPYDDWFLGEKGEDGQPGQDCSEVCSNQCVYKYNTVLNKWIKECGVLQCDESKMTSLTAEAMNDIIKAKLWAFPKCTTIKVRNFNDAPFLNTAGECHVHKYDENSLPSGSSKCDTGSYSFTAKGEAFRMCNCQPK